jgi:hypothetical protein
MVHAPCWVLPLPLRSAPLPRPRPLPSAVFYPILRPELVLAGARWHPAGGAPDNAQAVLLTTA